MSVGVPGTPARLAEGAARVRHVAAAPGAAAGHRRARSTASPSTRPSSTRPTRPRRSSPTSRPPRRCTSTPTARRATSAPSITNPDLARTYALIARKGPDALYSGPLAQAIVDTVKHPPLRPGSTRVGAPRRHGAQRPRRLQGDRPRPDAHRLPRAGRLRHGAALAAAARRWARSSTSSRAIRTSATMPRERALHLYLEASRLAYADRGAFVADPGYVSVPLAQLLSDQFAAQRRAKIAETAANSPVPAGDPSAVTDTSASTTRVGSTTNLTVSDRWGNVVDYTFTIEQTGGNGMVVPGYGFLLNNELTDFNLTDQHRPGRPGGVSTGANKVAGGKRPRSSIAPTIVLRNGRPFLALGSPGGASIITTVAQILVNRLDFGMTLPDAVAAPRLSQRNSATTQTEPALRATPEAAALAGPRPEVHGDHDAGLERGDRRRDRDRVPARRPGAGGRRADAPRRRQRARWSGRGRPRPHGHDGRHRDAPAARRRDAGRAPRLERAAPDQGLAQRDLVGVLEVGADRQAARPGASPRRRGRARAASAAMCSAVASPVVVGLVASTTSVMGGPASARARRARRSSGPRGRCRRSATARRRGRGSARGTRACARSGMTSPGSSTTQMRLASRRSSWQMRQRASSARLKHTSHSPMRSLTSRMASASALASSASLRRMWKARRWAVRWPMPGSLPSSVISRWTGGGYKR